MKLENLVPSLENCRKIPGGSFKDSAMVWMVWDGKDLVNKDKAFGKIVPRSMLDEFIKSLSLIHAALVEVLPAPTVDEIAMVTDGGIIVDYPSLSVESCLWEVGHEPMVEYWDENSNPADAALRLWFRINNKGE